MTLGSATHKQRTTILDDLRAIERHHRMLVLHMRRCFHATRRDGCPRCFSNHVLDTCAWLITDYERFEAEVKKVGAA